MAATSSSSSSTPTSSSGGTAPSSTAAERRAIKAEQLGATLPPVDLNPTPCPRCNSTNTKFCYYNNYNFSQPRHFCKGCRRYWTNGGTLRDIPVGGGTRKSAKRMRTSFATSSQPLTVSATTTMTGNAVGSSSLGPMIEPIPAVPVGSGFTGLLALGGFGLGLGMEEVGYGLGLGRGVWGFSHHDVGGYVSCGGGGGMGGSGGGNDGGCMGRGGGGGVMWHVESGNGGNGGGSGGSQGGYGGGECFSAASMASELAISTTGNGLK